MDLSKICTNCFKLKNDSAVCPHCGQTGAPAPKEAYHLQPGSVLAGRYLIGKTVGSGGFGVVYKSLDLKLGRIIALKEYFPVSLVCRVPGELNVSIYSGDKEAEYKKGLNRFLEEARNMAEFAREPHIVNVFDFFTANRTAYIVMEFLNGVSFAEYIESNSGKISVEDTIGIIKPILKGLKVLHERSIIHRDINPKNIFITADNKIKIIDFGTAKFCDENERTRTNIVSDGYAPPEQYKTRSVEAPYTDIYSIGATMYKAITGKTPTQALERAMNADSLPTPRSMDPDVPENIDIAIMKSMALKTNLRFQSVDELMSYLESPDSGVDYPEIEEKKRVFKRNIIVISSLVAVMVVLFTVLFATQKKDDLYDALKKSLDKTETIYMYIPYEDEDELEGLEPVYDALADDFAEYSDVHFGSDITLEPVFVPEDDYEDELRANEDGDKQVCIYSSNVSDVLDYETEKFGLLVDELDDEMCFADKYKDMYGPTYYGIPLSFRVYIQYSNRADKVDLDGITSWSDFEDKDADFVSFSISERAIEALYSALKNDRADSDTATKVLSRAISDGNVLNHNLALESFTGKESVFFIGSTEDLNAVRDSDLVMTYKTSNICGNSEDEWYGAFTQMWSVSDAVSESRVSASLLFLRYCLSEQAQTILHLDNSATKKTLAINKTVYEQQKNFVSDLQMLPEIEKIHIYSDESSERRFAQSFAEESSDIVSFVENNY